jgi:hypothetical protein
MTQALTWLVVILAIALIFWTLVQDNDRRRRRTAEEWEREHAAGQGTLNQFIRAGALGLEGILISEKREAIQYQKDEEQGMTKTGSKGDDADRTAVEESDGKRD